MPPHDVLPPDDARSDPAAGQDDLDLAKPVHKAPPPAAASQTGAAAHGAEARLEPVSEEDTKVHRPVGLVLRAAVAEGHSATGSMQPYDAAPNPEALLGPALLSELLAHPLTEGLRTPTPEAQARAKPFFDRWVHTARALGSGVDETRDTAFVTDAEEIEAASEAQPPRPAKAPQLAAGASGRRHYPIAERLLPEVENAPLAASTTAVFAASTSAEADVGAEVPRPARPPVGAPSIRPAAPRRRQPADVVPQDLLQQTSETALMWSEPSGGTSFRIDFADAFFADSACIITVKGHEVLATFYVADVNARRLLEAESRRLQDSLEARGLVHAQVRIVMAPAPEPFAPTSGALG